MFRPAFRAIFAACIAGSVIVVAGVLLGRWQRELDARPNNAPVGVIAMPLDELGVGAQTISNTLLTYRLSPYPPVAGQPHTLTLLALDRVTGQPRALPPTLEIGPVAQVDGTVFAMPVDATGYTATGQFFPQAGEWRIRVTVPLFENEDYSTIMLVRAR
jgi:hypothetical protein